jgi:hypothetical protein
MIEKRPDNKINLRKWCLYAAFVCLLVFATGCGKEVTAPSYDDEPDPVDEISMFAIVTNVDEVNGKITLQSVNYDTELVLNYNGGADVQDKYGDVLSISRLDLGTVADVVYDGNRNKLISLYVSSNEKVQKMEHISGAQVDMLTNTVKINGTSYQMCAGVSAFSEDGELQVNEICSEDQISVWFYNDMVCSIYVELGHGYLRLEDYASYIGGMVEVGYDVIVPVTEDMLLTVREGDYTLRISKGDDAGTKKVTVVRNQEVTLSLADIAIEPKQTGSVLFMVTPGDASVYIDGKKVNTEGAVDIVYGKHSILIQADGYESYSANFNVNYAYKIKEYTLTPSDDSTTESTTSSSTTAATTQATTTTETTTETTTTESDTSTSSSTTNKETANKVTVSSPSGASVYLDGEYIGVAPISFTKITGSHIITFSQTGYLSKSYTETFTDDGQDATLTYDALTSIASLIE